MQYLIIAVIGLVLLGGFLWYWQNRTIVCTTIHHCDSSLPHAFDGFCIVQVSDLHNRQFGRGQTRLLSRIEQSQPDIIVVTGDCIDRRRIDTAAALSFFEGACNIAPVYFVSGNHEQLCGIYDTFVQTLRTLGVIILDDTTAVLTRPGAQIMIGGLSDPTKETHRRSHFHPVASAAYQVRCAALQKKLDHSFSIVLAHRPEWFEQYVANGFCLVFCGHAHGGQVRLPYIGGLYAPEQGLFPRYTEGCYHKKRTTMVVSRGLGSSFFPTRVFNPPQLLALTLSHTNRATKRTK